MVEPLVEMLMPPVAERLEVWGAPMLMVLALENRLSAPVANRLETLGAESCMELFEKPAEIAP